VYGSNTTPRIPSLPHGYRMHDRYGIVYPTAPDQSDDLTQINGLTLQHLSTLNHHGIYLLRQLATWKFREQHAIAELMGMSVDQLVDLNWVEQARRLCRYQRPGLQFETKPVFRLLAAATTALLAGLAVTAVLQPRAAEPVDGILEARSTEITAPFDCTCAELHVRPGQEVFTGDPLLTLQNLEVVNRIDFLNAEITGVSQELGRLEAVANMEFARRETELNSDILDLRLFLVRGGIPNIPPPSRHLQTGWRKPTPLKSGVITEVASRPVVRNTGMIFFTPVSEASGSEGISEQAGTQFSKVNSVQPGHSQHLFLDQLEQQISRMTQILKELPQQIRKASGYSDAESQLSRLESELRQLQQQKTEYTVEAPSHGTVSLRATLNRSKTGKFERLLQILHHDERYIRLPVPTSRVPEFEPGDEVELIFPGHSRMLGRVTEIPLAADVTTHSKTSTVTLVIEHTGKLWPSLPIGSNVQVIPSH